MHEAPDQGVPDLGAVTPDIIVDALRLGWRDLRAEPLIGLWVALFYVLGGWVMTAITVSTGQTYWLVFAAIGFPLLGPFAAVAYYEVSRRRWLGLEIAAADVFGVVLRQSQRQLPSMCAVIVIVFLFWFFLAHMIFALFMGLSVMTNVSNSLDIYLTGNGLMMLGFGSIVGAGFALILFMITVFALPLLLDREIDFVTAMITSFQTVRANFLPLLGWGIFIAVATFVAMIPGFLGLLLVLPLLGHASWHLYALIKT